MEEKRLQPYEKLKFYQDICVIRSLIYRITERFAKNHLRLVSEMRAAARSAKQNIREGYKKGTFGEYVHGIDISRGSLEELKGDVEDCFEDGLINKDESEQLNKLFRSADYMSTHYIKAICELEKKGKWKRPIRSYSR